MPRIVKVRLLDAPFRADGEYDYLLNETIEGELYGRIAIVPFGKGDRASYAVVVGEGKNEGERRLKEVKTLLPEDFRVLPEILRLCFFLSEYTLSSVGEAVRAAIPAAALGLLSCAYRAKGEGRAERDASELALRVNASRAEAKEKALYAYLSAVGTADEDALFELFGKGIKKNLSALLEKGLAERVILRRADARARVERVYAVCEDESASRERIRRNDFKNETQSAVYRFLFAEGECSEGEILERLNVSLSPLRTLVKNGLLSVCEREVERNPYEKLSGKCERKPVCLSRAQERAYEELSALYEKESAACALLHGITGSGKTQVMMKLLDRVLDEGKQAILLVPEIALTPQTVGIFCSRYGRRVSVLHSSLSTGERYDAYRKILRGETDLVIGTRSAVFAPLSRLGLIIIDEEHEHTYKSDAAPRYHTRDVAAYRSGAHGALTVLASATPSIESYYKAKTGKYTLVSLTERYGGALLPKTEIVDMREELKAGNTSPISRTLEEALRESVEDESQAVLFLNRRGYHHSISCKSCGEPLVCEHCSVSLTYHTSYRGGYLLCHACGAKKEMPRACPKCASEHLSYVGAGTQKAEASLKEAIDGIRVLRMDADTTGAKSAYERLLGKFRRREADVLLGTQMVTKGHDFPAVALSGVLLADTSLYMNDFRAAERTFALLTQVIGRAGRASDTGRAIVQTFSPSHKVITLAAAQDYPAFYEEEIALRRALHYPPFSDVVQVLLVSEDEPLLLRAAREARDRLIALFKEKDETVPVEIYGPLEPQTYKVAERYRMRLLLKTRLSREVRGLMAEFLRTFLSDYPKITATVDFNPTDT